jgi:hypothetical protein
VASRGHVGTVHRGIRWNNLSLDDSLDVGTTVEDENTGLRRRLVVTHQCNSNHNSQFIAMLRVDLE